ncbi:MAG: TetR/AcrR family transcriptional regulator [Myxococcaceae bacterium]|nr:TetR/AcrR family transcriptional regulator [Myxococcaceae bacterium]
MPAKDRTRRRATPKQARARASADAILTAADQLLRQKGFAKLTTNAIADRAGVNVALVYRYFAGKEAIVGALIEREASATRESVRATLALQARSSLKVAVRALLEALTGTPHDPLLHRELFENVGATKRVQLLRGLQAEVVDAFAAFLRARRLKPAAATMFVLQHAIEATTHAAAFYRPPGLTTAAVLDVLTTMVLSALRAPESSRPA